MSNPETVKIKPSHPSQGDHVLINKSDFDPKKHELFDEQEALASKGEKKPSDGLTIDKIKEALASKGVEIPDGVTLKADLAALLDAAP